MAVNVSIPKGTRDFSPAEMIRRKYIFQTVEDVFRLYGYLPIETPAMENLSTLTGKYGEEGDRLIFKILNSGNYLEGISVEDIQNSSTAKLAARMCEKALRYDLTVPFARYVVQNRNEITFPFKRYQIQPVWRADRPQKGRYREFYQCDVDVIGSNSLLNEVELIQIIDAVFQQLGLNITIKLNNRKILSGIAEVIGAPDKVLDIAIALDKADKIGWENVDKELENKGISRESRTLLYDIFDYGERSGLSIVSNAPPAPDRIALSNLKNTLKDSNIGCQGINEIYKIINFLNDINPVLDCKVEFDPTLARGLNYYTGAIFEVKANDVAMGSICGGGRYDDLTGIFGLPDVSGVGVSFGADRIYDVMNELELFPENAAISTKILFTNHGENEIMYALEAIKEIRRAGISAELFPDNIPLKKQLSYANKRKIPYVALGGSIEMSEKCFTFKEMNVTKNDNTPNDPKKTLLEIIALLKK